MVAELNFCVAVLILLMALAIGVSHYRERGLGKVAFLGATVIVLAVVNVISSMTGPLGLQDHIDGIRFAAAVFRGIALVLLLAYVLFRWRR